MALSALVFWLPLLLLPFLLLALLMMVEKKTFNRKLKQHLQLPRSPPRLPILGNLHQIGVLSHRVFWQLSKKYGPVFVLHLGLKPVVIVSSAEAARDVLKVNDLASCSRPSLVGCGRLTHNYLDLAFAPYGDYWREIRKTCVLELFSVKKVQSFRFIREEEVASLMNLISQSSASATPVNITEKSFSLTGSIVFRMSFGRSFQGSSFDHHGFHEAVHEAETVMGSFFAEDCFPYVGWIVDRITGRHALLEKVFHKMDTFFQQIIDEHLNKPRSGRRQEDIIDVLLRIQRDQSEGPDFAGRFTKNHIKGILLNIFLAGVDTSALTVTWAMTELARNPRLMKKAQDEVRSLVGNKGSVNESDLDQLQYLNAVIKETLRLHPPAPLLLARETMFHFKLNGYDIEPKTLIQINVWAIARDPKYWKDPEEFWPERFADSSIDFKGQNFEFLPFGAGRRGCPGIYMGLITAEILLANLLYCFDWELPDGMNEEDINVEESTGLSLTLSKKIPLVLVPVKSYLQ